MSTRNRLLDDPDGHNHANVAEWGVAALVADWIIAAERERGDLR